MKAVAATPGVAQSTRLIDLPTPTPSEGQVRVKVIRVGIDGTDLEIDRAEYGQAPAGDHYLILGHESFGQVESVGAGVKELAPGDYVVALVRRPDDCPPCRAGEPDMCIQGDYTERGIKAQHGFLSEYYVESPEYLVKLPPDLADVGVLLEPLTVVEKGVRHAWTLEQRMKVWQPEKALILGAGPIGLMAAMLTRLRGLETTVYARNPDPAVGERVAAIGATYVAKLNAQGEVANHLGALPRRFGPFDFILEATGAAQVAVGAMGIIGVNGVLCLTSVTGGEDRMEICAACLNLELVLGNRAVFGTVNASRVDFETGVRDLAEARQRWPGWLESLITRRVPADRFREAFERRPGDIKILVEL